MDAAAKGRPANSLRLSFAGLEAGMLGALWMLAWMGLSYTLQQRSFWTPENLMATAFDRNSSLAPLFTWATCAGLALYILIYSALGAAFSGLLRDRVPQRRVMLLAVIYAVVWYYFSFRWMFKLGLPLVALLHVEHTTIVGHLLYGTMLGRYPLYVHRLMNTAPPAAPTEEAPAVEAPVVAGETGEQTPGGHAAEGL